MQIKQEFINKWKCWWMLQKRGAELTDAFEKELNAIIEQEISSRLVKADVIKSVYCDCKNPDPNVDDKGTKYCRFCDRDFEKQ